MQKWIVTGVSGCERIELLNELAVKIGEKAIVHDVGNMMREEAKKYRIPITDERVLDMDSSQLRLLRAAALKEVRLAISKSPTDLLHLIGVHATFRWKGRLLPGMSYQDVLEIQPDGFINVVRDVKAIMERNTKNPKWDSDTLPNLQETQEWMMMEEFATEILSEVVRRPIFLIGRTHNLDNLSDLFFTKKKKIYLSYPITPIEKEEPQLLEKIQGPILKELEKLFVVFNPLTIKDMALTNKNITNAIPEFVEQLTDKAVEIIKTRTIERDFQFIDQSDAVVVIYPTDKVSPGVLAEIYYAHRNQKPVFMFFHGKKSPFIEDATTQIEPTLELLMDRLTKYAS